jgi:long-chain acyl-CoA synthetase
VLEDRCAPTRSSASAWSSATRSPSSPASSPSTRGLPAWAERHGKPATTAAELADDPTLLAELQKAVDDANRAVLAGRGDPQVRVLPEDWTEEGGQITPSLKVKRSVVLARYTDDVERLYAGPRS